MTGALYDYLIGLTTMGVIFISAVFIVPQLSYVNLLYLDQQQLRNIANQTLKAVLLETGYPIDWGATDLFDPDSIIKFGLAASTSSSFYVLDPDKVQRLVSDNPLGSIEYYKMKELLGLEGYGFSISIIPPFNVTIENNKFEFDNDDAEMELEVYVSSRSGAPIANAVVELIIIYSTKKGGTAKLYFVRDMHLTDSLGKCKIEKHLDAQSGETFSDIIAVFKVTVADLTTIVVVYQDTPPGDIADINIVGDEIILTHPGWIPPEGQPPTARWVYNIIQFNEQTFTVIYSGSKRPEDLLTYGQGYKVWSKVFNGLKKNNPSVILFNFYVLGRGQPRTVLLAGPNPNWLGSRVLNYGGLPALSGSAVKIERTVVISGMTYVLELTMWKEAL
jgi:hypothetical protein